jgi:hypothetical protein
MEVFMDGNYTNNATGVVVQAYEVGSGTPPAWFDAAEAMGIIAPNGSGGFTVNAEVTVPNNAGIVPTTANPGDWVVATPVYGYYSYSAVSAALFPTEYTPAPGR